MGEQLRKAAASHSDHTNVNRRKENHLPRESICGDVKQNRASEQYS